MLGIEHEAAVEVLRGSPELAATLLASVGVRVPGGAAAVVADSNLTIPAPTELRADMVTIHRGPDRKLAVVIEVQKDPPDRKKRRAWLAYLAGAQLEHDCDAVLLVIALRPGTARVAARAIRIGHPGLFLAPVVIGPANTPAAGRGTAAAAGLTVLGVLTGAVDLADPDERLSALSALARADSRHREAYTRIIRATATMAVRQALEDLMTTAFKDEFVDGLLDQGRAEGEAAMLLQVLRARGFEVTASIRQQVVNCADTGQLEAWARLAVNATSLCEIFAA